MTNTNERLEIRQVHDNDKYIVTRTIVEEMDGKTLAGIYDQILKGIGETNHQLNDVPKQTAERMKGLKYQLETLNQRVVEFAKHVKTVNDEEKAQEQANTINEGSAE